MARATFNKKTKGDVSVWVWVVLAVIGLLIVLTAVNVQKNYERRERSFYQPISESRANPYFVAGEYLKQNNKSVHWESGERSVVALAELVADFDNASGRLLILDQLDARQLAQATAILEWVEAGGHVITFAQKRLDKTAVDLLEDSDTDEYRANENPLLAELGIYHLSVPESADYRHQDDYAFLPACGTALRLDGRLVVVDGHCGQLVATDTDKFVPYDYRVFKANGATGTHLQASLQALLGKAKNEKQAEAFTDFLANNPTSADPARVLLDGQVGKGRLTVLADNQIFSNPYGGKVSSEDVTPELPTTLWEKLDRTKFSHLAYGGGISGYDHAYLFDFLSKNADEVWFFASVERPSFFMLLWQNFRFGLIAMVLMVLAMVLALPRQFGRYESLADDTGKNVLRYFSHVASYLWRVDKMAGQVANNRTTLKKRLKARVMGLTHVADDDVEGFCTVLSERLNVDAETVFLALFAEWDGQGEFVAITQAMAEVEGRFREMGRG